METVPQGSAGGLSLRKKLGQGARIEFHRKNRESSGGHCSSSRPVRAVSLHFVWTTRLAMNFAGYERLRD